MKKSETSSRNKLILSSIAVVLIAAAFVCGIYFYPLGRNNGDKRSKPSQKDNTSEITSIAFDNIDLGNGLIVTSIDKYSGNFVEAGSDSEHENLIMIEVENHSKRTLQYAVISAVINGKNSEFELSTIPGEARVHVFEKTAQTANGNIDYSDFRLSNAVFFEDEPSMCSDTLEITVAEGIINVRNISSEDIKGSIYVYYKNFRDGAYYGGITYRSGFDGGLKAGEVKQLNASHYSLTDGRLMFVNYV